MSNPAPYPARKHPRIKVYNYSTEGAYFLTLCTKNRQPILSTIAVGRGILDAPLPQLTDIGRCVESALHYMEAHTPGLTVDKYVLMPNHLHLILVLDAATCGASGRPRPTDAVIPKFVSSLKRYTNRVCAAALWQDTFHDHVIRSETDYLRIWQYIDTNPAKWSEDRYYAEEMTPTCTLSASPC